MLHASWRSWKFVAFWLQLLKSRIVIVANCSWELHESCNIPSTVQEMEGMRNQELTFSISRKKQTRFNSVKPNWRLQEVWNATFTFNEQQSYAGAFNETFALQHRMFLSFKKEDILVFNLSKKLALYRVSNAGSTMSLTFSYLKKFTNHNVAGRSAIHIHFKNSEVLSVRRCDIACCVSFSLCCREQPLLLPADPTKLASGLSSFQFFEKWYVAASCNFQDWLAKVTILLPKQCSLKATYLCCIVALTPFQVCQSMLETARSCETQHSS